MSEIITSTGRGMDIGIIYHLFDSCLLYQYRNMFGAVQLNTTMQNKVLPLKLNFLCVSIQLNQQTGYEYQKLSKFFPEIKREINGEICYVYISCFNIIYLM